MSFHDCKFIVHKLMAAPSERKNTLKSATTEPREGHPSLVSLSRTQPPPTLDVIDRPKTHDAPAFVCGLERMRVFACLYKFVCVCVCACVCESFDGARASETQNNTKRQEINYLGNSSGKLFPPCSYDAERCHL
jgi:hypothetical protein